MSPLTEMNLLLENVKYVDNVFDSGSSELLQLESFQGHQLGIVLVSANTCKVLVGTLLVQADIQFFTVMALELLGKHFHRYCQNNWKFFIRPALWII